MCAGFSRTILGILSDEGVKFGYYDILGDEEVRAGLKSYSDWPTYPQLYTNGELLGGLDIVKVWCSLPMPHVANDDPYH